MAFVQVPRLKLGAATSVLCIVAVLGAPGSSFAAPNEAAGVVKATQELYGNIRTFSARITAVRSGKTPKGSFAETISEQTYYKAPNIFFQHVNISGSGLAAQVKQQLITVSNGSTILQYDALHKVYVKSPAPKTASPIAILQMKFNLATAHVLKSTSMFGRPCYEIQVEAQLPAKFPPSVTKAQLAQIHEHAKVVLTIDKANHKLLQLYSAAAGLRETIKGQVVNGSIPASRFHFTPPAGSKEVHPQAPPTPGR